jgi:hypothetical protein
MLLVVLEELLGYPGLPGAHKHDLRGGDTVSRNMQLALRSRLLE